MAKLAPLNTNLNYDDEINLISNFVTQYKETEQSDLKFMGILQAVANRELKQIVVELEDIVKFERSKEGLVKRIQNNTKGYIELFSHVFDKIKPSATVEWDVQQDVIDVIMQQRILRGGDATEDANLTFPPSLTRRYTVVFKPLDDDVTLAVRELKSKYIGNLVTLRGIVTRVTDVKPLLIVNAYSCDQCGCELFQEVKNKTYLPLTDCLSTDCKKNAIKGKLYMQTRSSKFLKFQEAKVQESADQVPAGHTPRSATIHLYEDLTRTVNPGDTVNISGILLATPFVGFKGIRAGLQADTYIHAQFIHQHKKTFDTTDSDAAMLEQIHRIRDDPERYERLSQSIAPEIYGMEDVKKALLLLLVGSGTKTTQDGMKIRGDINICLMGDPGVAKSQLLKFITKVAPRAVYTTGRGSSGVGLTAAVMRDPVTDEFVLEGGALVLADNGICCIDEFDKMDERDRTAIHEVMEQQTISISKAGINTTLNARTSILAAANPAFGRYNLKRSPAENINLPAALLSRFDMLYLLLDQPSSEHDRLLAEHVTKVHMGQFDAGTVTEGIISPELMRHYIAHARQFDPVVSKDVVDSIVSEYVTMRKNAADQTKGSKGSYVTPRSLLAIIRLSKALASVRFSDQVHAEDIQEALRLLQVTKAQLDQGNLDMTDRDVTNDRTALSAIFNLIKDLAVSKFRVQSKNQAMTFNEVLDRIKGNGFTKEQLVETLEYYDSVNVLKWDKTRKQVAVI